jgi:hypothetical protein
VSAPSRPFDINEDANICEREDRLIFIDFLRRILAWDPRTRLTAAQALLHPFILGPSSYRPRIPRSATSLSRALRAPIPKMPSNVALALSVVSCGLSVPCLEILARQDAVTLSRRSATADSNLRRIGHTHFASIAAVPVRPAVFIHHADKPENKNSGEAAISTYNPGTQPGTVGTVLSGRMQNQAKSSDSQGHGFFPTGRNHNRGGGRGQKKSQQQQQHGGNSRQTRGGNGMDSMFNAGTSSYGPMPFSIGDGGGYSDFLVAGVMNAAFPPSLQPSMSQRIHPEDRDKKRRGSHGRARAASGSGPLGVSDLWQLDYAGNTIAFDAQGPHSRNQPQKNRNQRHSFRGLPSGFASALEQTRTQISPVKQQGQSAPASQERPIGQTPGSRTSWRGSQSPFTTASGNAPADFTGGSGGGGPSGGSTGGSGRRQLLGRSRAGSGASVGSGYSGNWLTPGAGGNGGSGNISTESAPPPGGVEMPLDSRRSSWRGSRLRTSEKGMDKDSEGNDLNVSLSELFHVSPGIGSARPPISSFSSLGGGGRVPRDIGARNLLSRDSPVDDFFVAAQQMHGPHLSPPISPSCGQAGGFTMTGSPLGMRAIISRNSSAYEPPAEAGGQEHFGTDSAYAYVQPGGMGQRNTVPMQMVNAMQPGWMVPQGPLVGTGDPTHFLGPMPVLVAGQQHGIPASEYLGRPSPGSAAAAGYSPERAFAVHDPITLANMNAPVMNNTNHYLAPVPVPPPLPPNSYVPMGLVGAVPGVQTIAPGYAPVYGSLTSLPYPDPSFSNSFVSPPLQQNPVAPVNNSAQTSNQGLYGQTMPTTLFIGEQTMYNEMSMMSMQPPSWQQRGIRSYSVGSGSGGNMSSSFGISVGSPVAANGPVGLSMISGGPLPDNVPSPSQSQTGWGSRPSSGRFSVGISRHPSHGSEPSSPGSAAPLPIAAANGTPQTGIYGSTPGSRLSWNSRGIPGGVAALLSIQNVPADPSGSGSM